MRRAVADLLQTVVLQARGAVVPYTSSVRMKRWGSMEKLRPPTPPPRISVECWGQGAVPDSPVDDEVDVPDGSRALAQAIAVATVLARELGSHSYSRPCSDVADFALQLAKDSQVNILIVIITLTWLEK